MLLFAGANDALVAPSDYSKLLAKPEVEGVAVSPLGHLATRHLHFKSKK